MEIRFILLALYLFRFLFLFLCAVSENLFQGLSFQLFLSWPVFFFSLLDLPSFIIKYLLSISHVPGSVLDTRDVPVNKEDKVLAPV